VPNQAADEIRAAIQAAPPGSGGRAISFEHYMRLALYGVGGFYATDGAAGRRGDFITSPEVGPLFGAVIARMVDDAWRVAGSPQTFTVVDAGAGPATLLRSIRAAVPVCLHALQFVAVETSASQRSGHPEFFRSLAELPAEPFDGVVIANELLDNLPFRLFVMDGGWREAYVVEQRDGAFAEVLRSADDLDALALPAAAHGARVPVQQCGRWVADAMARLRRGRLVLVDYAAATTVALAGRPYREWLRTYRGHERGSHYLRDAGQQDITNEVALDQLFGVAGEPDAVRTQAQFLQRWGIDELVQQGRQVWSENVTRPTVAALTMRSRVREAEALLDPDGLGAFTVVEYSAP